MKIQKTLKSNEQYMLTEFVCLIDSDDQTLYLFNENGEEKKKIINTNS